MRKRKSGKTSNVQRPTFNVERLSGGWLVLFFLISVLCPLTAGFAQTQDMRLDSTGHYIGRPAKFTAGDILIDGVEVGNGTVTSDSLEVTDGTPVVYSETSGLAVRAATASEVAYFTDDGTTFGQLFDGSSHIWRRTIYGGVFEFTPVGQDRLLGVLWAGISKTGSDLADLETRNFSSLQNIPINLVPLVNTGTLNFPSTAADADSDLTITVTGAALGDVVSLGIPNASMVANSYFIGWVSASDTVTVRFHNAQGSGSLDPASGTFRAMVTQFAP